ITEALADKSMTPPVGPHRCRGNGKRKFSTAPNVSMPKAAEQRMFAVPQPAENLSLIRSFPSQRRQTRNLIGGTAVTRDRSCKIAEITAASSKRQVFCIGRSDNMQLGFAKCKSKFPGFGPPEWSKRFYWRLAQSPRPSQ